MAKIVVTIVNTVDGQAYSAEMVLDKPVGLCIEQILFALDLPTEENGKRIRYNLVIERTGQIVSEKEALQSAGVQAGDVLRLERAKAIAAADGPTARTILPGWIWIIGGIAIFAFSAFLLIVGGRFISEQSAQHVATQTVQAWNIKQTSTANMAAAEGSLATATAHVYQVTQTKRAVITQTVVAQQAATAHAEATVAQATFQTVPANWPIHFQDSFSNQDNKWLTGSRETERVNLQMEIVDGVYRIEAVALKDFSLTLIHPMDFVSDIHLTADVHQLNGPRIRQFGVVFRAVDFDNHGFFGISDDGQFLVDIKTDGKSDLVIDWSRSSSIRKGEVNQLTIIAEEDHYQFFINGTLVGELDDNQLQSGKAGIGFSLAQGNTATFEFDNFVLRAK